MTRLRSLVLGGATAALVLGGAASKSFAIEPDDFTNHLQGGSIGAPLGAAPPPGLYSGFIEFIVPSGSLHNTGNGGTDTVNAQLAAIPLVWSTGWNVLGASYTMAVAQAFYVGAAFAPTENPQFATGALAFAVVANTGFTPISLSWNLHNGWFIGAGFNFTAPDGTQGPVGNPNPDYWTFEPTFAVSYIDKNWVASANFAYDINTVSQGKTMVGINGYTSGNLLYGDFFVAYKFGKWEIGPAAYIVEQTTNDTVSLPGGCANAVVVAAGGCALEHEVGLGGLIGYDFGPVDLHVWATDDIGCNTTTNNVGCGIKVFGSLGFRLWAPEAPKPLVAKN